MKTMVNTTKGRKGAWHVKNTAAWDRKDNKANEAVARNQATFIDSFINEQLITVEDTMAVYALGTVYEQSMAYTFELHQSPDDEVLGVMAAGKFLSASK